MNEGPFAKADKQAPGQSAPFVGQPVERLEDAALLSGRGRYADDIGVKPGTLHAAVLRSPHAHAEVVAIDEAAALNLPGVRAVLIGADVRQWAAPFVVGVKQPMEHWCLAQDRVRYVGEPVAVVVAEDRYLAEDALDLVNVSYRPLPALGVMPLYHTMGVRSLLAMALVDGRFVCVPKFDRSSGRRCA